MRKKKVESECRLRVKLRGAPGMVMGTEWGPGMVMGVRGRSRLGWMDGVKVALGNRGMTVEADRKSGEPWYICNPMNFTFLLGTVFFRPSLSCFGGYQMEMRLG